MENSLVLLSSMSPKVSHNRKHTRRHPVTKLALKKNLRRSSIFDKKAEISGVIVVDNSTESSSTSGDVKQFLNTTPIIISDSEEEGSTAAVCIQRRSVQRVTEIEHWIENVNLENEKAKLSMGISEKDARVCSANSVFDDKKYKCFSDDMFQHKTEKGCLGNIIENSPCDTDNESECGKSVVEDSSKESEVLSESDFEKNSFKDCKELEESDDGNDRKLTENSNEVHTPETKSNKSKSITVASDDDTNEISQAAEVLDELYGNSWRANENNVLTPSESRSNRKLHPPSRSAKTEPKLFVYRNPYLDAESSMSKNLLNSLYKARVEVKLKSPIVNNLRKLCDPDSDSASEKEIVGTRKKLNFDGVSDKENLNENCLKSDKHNGVFTKSKYWSFGDSLDKLNPTQLSENNLKSLDKKQKKDFEGSKKHAASTLKVKQKVPRKTGSEKKQPKKFVKKSIDEVSSSTGSDKEDSDEQWWKPSRKSVLKLYKERKATKVFGFLASLSKNVPVHQSDPSALIYRGNFKEQRDALVQKLFKLYNETIFEKSIPEDTPFVWNTRMRGTAGYCYCRRAVKHGEVVSRSVRIVLSTKVVDSAERVRDTLVHELCHAATWMVNNVHNGHGTYWKAWADKAMAVYPELPPIRRCHDYDINTKYTYRCVNCGYSIGRHTKSLDIDRKRCGHCYGKFEVLLNKQAKGITVQSTPRKATGFALFVKENYATVKAPNLNHGKVMKLLGQKFAELKVTQAKD